VSAIEGPLSLEWLEEIRADLAAVPAPPWRWIGCRGAGGPQLVTAHSGSQYILRAAKPMDRHGEEITDADDSPVYGDLQFRDQRPDEKYAVMRSGSELAVGRAVYDPDNIASVDNPVARWLERSASHAELLVAEVGRLAAALAEAEARVAELRQAPVQIVDRAAVVVEAMLSVGATAAEIAHALAVSALLKSEVRPAHMPAGAR
jgi:hypothetical protein